MDGYKNGIVEVWVASFFLFFFSRIKSLEGTSWVIRSVRNLLLQTSVLIKLQMDRT